VYKNNSLSQPTSYHYNVQKESKLSTFVLNNKASSYLDNSINERFINGKASLKLLLKQFNNFYTTKNSHILVAQEVLNNPQLMYLFHWKVDQVELVFLLPISTNLLHFVKDWLIWFQRLE